MNRNTESHFSLSPHVDISRSRFDRSASLKTSFNVGDVVPFFLDEVLPGDTFSVDTSKVVRMQTLLTPMMDNVYLDTYYFFIPNRLVWDHWKEFCGENTESAWIPETEYTMPQITAPANGGWSVGTLADYFGVPTGVSGLSISALPFRAYALVINEWFRDQNLQDPLVVPTDDSTVAGVNTATFVTDVAKGGKPFIAAKYHDYFTSALPSPQKGPDVTIPVAEAGNYNVVGNGKSLALTTGGSKLGGLQYGYEGAGSSQSTLLYATYGSFGQAPGSASSTGGLGSNVVLGVPTQAQLGSDLSNSGLIAVASGNAAAATINQLRLAFQIQKFYEQQARGGSRYTEVVRSFFGVTSPDARLQRPEYLGGNRVPINVNQIIQQSGTESSGTPQGTVVGQSLTTDSHSDFTKSFTEHGLIIGVMVARYDHTYQQGLNRLWSRKDKFDFYWPVFANIGEQAIKNKEIFAQGNTKDDEVFGYQEAWAEYRYKPNMVTGEMRSAYAQSLDVWHLADDYATLPTLSDAWIREDKSNVDRVLAVQSSVSNQLFADIYVKNYCTRPMPMYSIPGLIDHH
ncbi:MAG: major capsid protein [Microviridae sp.]|nr:MAG: major capsid protein [Microviridae sp.]AXQ66323.1 MAG: major capsid protein [Microviridae sp.]